MSTAGPPVMGGPAPGTPATAGPPRPPRSVPEAPQATCPPRPHPQPPVHLQPCDVKGEITPQAPPTGEVPPVRLAARRDTPRPSVYRDFAGHPSATHRPWPQPALAGGGGETRIL